MTSGSVAYPFTGTGAVGPDNPSGFVWLLGISGGETGGASPVRVTLRDTATSSGSVVGVFTLPAGTSLGNCLLPRVRVKSGVFATVTVTGSGTFSAVLNIQ